MYSNVLRFNDSNKHSKIYMKMAPSGHFAVFSCSSSRGNNCYKPPKDAMFGLFGPFYYFFRLEISFTMLLESDWLAFEVSYKRKSFLSDVLSAESESMDQKRCYVETGNTPNKPLRKRPTSTGSPRKSLFGSPSSGKSVSEFFFLLLQFKI